MIWGHNQHMKRDSNHRLDMSFQTMVSYKYLASERFQWKETYVMKNGTPLFYLVFGQKPQIYCTHKNGLPAGKLTYLLTVDLPN